MIKVKNLSYTYRKQRKPTINGLDFTVGAGEIFGFLGPSGAGKSTTQKVLIGLLGGFQGNVELLGQSVSSWRRDLYKEIGVAFESPNLYGKLSAKENLEYFCGLSQGDPSLIPELLDRVGLWADADKMVDQFSKGMKMRLNVVRAFLHNPKILFLDEPTSGLDPASAVRVKDLIREARSKGKAIFLTTHNMNLADELCDNLAFLNKGEIAAMNTPHKLKAAHGERRVQVVVDGQEKYFPMDDLVGSSDFLDFLGSGTLERIHSLEAPMEEVFLKVTGSVLW